MPKLNDTLLASITSLTRQQVPTPQLDAEVLLAHTLRVSRSWLHAHSNDRLTQEQVRVFQKLIERRLNREPVSYITGTKEFFAQEFIVTPDVLIPRPETEELIELVLKQIDSIYKDFPCSKENPCSVLDVGCGSGCVGITLKLECPELNVSMCDISPAALEVARKNARKLGAKPLRFVVSDLLEHWLSHGRPKPFDMIVANLPYVDESWETSPETSYEPSLALYADQNGLALIFQLIEQSESLLTSNGSLLLEADPEQHQAIIHFASTHGLAHKSTKGYAISFMKLPQA